MPRCRGWPPPPPSLVSWKDVDMKPVGEQPNRCAGGGESAPGPAPGQSWLKPRLVGARKASNKERRRRQNEILRRLLTPKSALMVLHEMIPCNQLSSQFKVEPVAKVNPYFNKASQYSFCADLTLRGTNYRGYGENRLVARNVAAEQALRDIIIDKMKKAFDTDNGGGAGAGEGQGEAEGEEEALPMLQLASFALYKLFGEWQAGGLAVPPLRAAAPDGKGKKAAAGAGAGGGEAKERELPVNAARMHPCTVLAYMRPQLQYRQLAAHGDRPQNMVFTLGVDVDGSTYIGKASNKKEARKQAATAACEAVFGLRFQGHPVDTVPQRPACA